MEVEEVQMAKFALTPQPREPAVDPDGWQTVSRFLLLQHTIYNIERGKRSDNRIRVVNIVVKQEDQLDDQSIVPSDDLY